MLNLSTRIVDTLNLTTNKVNTVTLKPYEIDSRFYLKLDSFASDWATHNIDSGKTQEGYFSIALNTGLSLISWKADSIEEQNLFDSVVIFRDTLLGNLISLWQADTLITDYTKSISYLDEWRQDSKLANLTDTLCFFKRRDNYIEQDILKRYRSNYKDEKSYVFFGFADSYFDQLIIAFRLVGEKPLN